MDVGMPKRNGYEATRRIREQPWGKNIIIIALTGWGQDVDPPFEKRRLRRPPGKTGAFAGLGKIAGRIGGAGEADRQIGPLVCGWLERHPRQKNLGQKYKRIDLFFAQDFFVIGLFARR